MVATVISALGSYAFNFAFMAYIYDISGHDKSFMGLTQLFFVTGMLIGNVTAGPLGERSNRRNLLTICEVIRIPLSIVFLLTNNIWALLITHGLKTIFAGISTPCKRAFINDITPVENIAKANNIFSASYALVHILGPLIGTWGYSYFKSITNLVYFDISTFIIAPALFMLINVTHFKKIATHSFVADIKDGINYVKNRFDLRGLYERHALIGIFSGIVIPLILPFMHDVLGKGEKEYGVAMLIFGLGGLSGALINKKVISKFGIGRVLVFTSFIEPLFLLIWALGINYYISQTVFYFWGVLFFVRVPSQFSYLSHHVAKGYISRTNALLDFIFTLTNISASAIISILGQRVNTKELLVGCALLYFIINLSRMFAISSKELLTPQEVVNE